MHTFYAFDESSNRYYRFRPSLAWLEKNDNGHAVSIGFRIGEDITERQLRSLNAQSCTREEWSHSGCLSKCVWRGASKCQW